MSVRKTLSLAEVGDVAEVPGAEGANPPAKRARYIMTLKDDSASPGAVPAAAPNAPPPKQPLRRRLTAGNPLPSRAKEQRTMQPLPVDA